MPPSWTGPAVCKANPRFPTSSLLLVPKTCILACMDSILFQTAANHIFPARWVIGQWKMASPFTLWMDLHLQGQEKWMDLLHSHWVVGEWEMAFPIALWMDLPHSHPLWKSLLHSPVCPRRWLLNHHLTLQPNMQSLLSARGSMDWTHNQNSTWLVPS